MSHQPFPSLFKSLSLCALFSAAIMPTHAWAQSDGIIVDPEEEEEVGVPHIVIGAQDGSVVVEEFDGVQPTSAADLSALFPQFASVLNDNVPTVVIAVGASQDPSGNPIATSTQFSVPGNNLPLFEFISNPLSGLGSGFVNDDNGFEVSGAGLPGGTDIQIDLSVPDGLAEGTNDPFFIALGANLFTNIGNPIVSALDGPGFEIIEDGEVVDIITGTTLSSFLTLGDSFDIHPLFGLSLSEASATGSALIEATFSDVGGSLVDSEPIRFLVTNNTAAFEVPEPATAGLLALGGMALAARRRRA